MICMEEYGNGRIHRGMYRCKLYNVNEKVSPSSIEDSGIGVVAALAQPAVLQWNEHEWRNEAMMPSATTAMIS